MCIEAGSPWDERLDSEPIGHDERKRETRVHTRFHFFMLFPYAFSFFWICFHYSSDAFIFYLIGCDQILLVFYRDMVRQP